MKKIYYCHIEQVNENAYLYYNAFNNCYLILNALKNNIYQEKSPDEIREIDIVFYTLLVENGFFVEDVTDEVTIVDYKKMLTKMDTTLYHIVINTTLDCNLNCWYCYESKKVGSLLTDSVIDLIKKNIEEKYKTSPYKKLKISFFGGEPLMNFKAIEGVLSYASLFVKEKDVSLIADFTTNATLMTEEMIAFLKSYHCTFQITLDGYEEKHNKVRFFQDKKGTYETILNNVYKLQNGIPQSSVWIRINYDAQTLKYFSNIIDDLSGLSRKNTFIILRKIWQLDTDKIKKVDVLSAIKTAIDNNFFIDNYALPRTKLCFAERLNQVLFNYDGKVFKCSTLEDFDDANSEGKICNETGLIQWNLDKIAKKIMQTSPQKCLKCKIYPVCLGPCGTNVQKGDDNFRCMIDSTGLSISEFIMYNFKLTNLLNSLSL